MVLLRAFQLGGDPSRERVELVQNLLDVHHEPLREGPGEILPHHHPQDGDVLGVRGHGVGGDDPPEAPEHVGDFELVVAAVVLEAERHERDAVVFGNDVEPAGSLQAFLKHHRVVMAVLHDVTVPLRAVDYTRLITSLNNIISGFGI